MTNINCSSDCKHQKDGKCTLNYTPQNITIDIEAGNSDCVFYQNKASQ